MSLRSPKPAFSFTTVLMVLVVCLALTVAGLKQLGYVRQTQVKRKVTLKAVWAAESGMAHALAYCSNMKQWGELGGLNGKKLTWPTQQTAQISAAAMLGFVMVTVEGRAGEATHKLQALVGQKPLETSANRLVIADGEQPFYSSGNSRIEGDLVLPGGVVQPKSLHGVAASVGPVVTGETKAYKPSDAPEIKPFSATQYAGEIARARTMLIGRDSIPKEPVWDLNNRASFHMDNLVLPKHLTEIRGPGKLVIQGSLVINHPLRLSGNPRIICGNGLTINAPVQIGATLIAGGKIQVQGALEGAAAIISNEAISLGPEVRLNSPSWIWVSPFKELATRGRPSLLIEGSVKGLITSWTENNTVPLIRIRRSAQVEGLIYSKGRMIAEAPITGHIWTQTFETLQGARAFQNWFRNTEVRAPNKPLPAVPFGFGNGAQISSWIKR